MSTDRPSALAAAAQRRHDDTRRHASQALRRLDAAGQPISFAAIAKAAGVSRAWLYRDAAIRAEIERLRRRRSPTTRNGRPAAELATADSTREQLEALRALAAELRAENQQLREALARKLGQRRATVTDDHG